MATIGHTYNFTSHRHSSTLKSPVLNTPDNNQASVQGSLWRAEWTFSGHTLHFTLLLLSINFVQLSSLSLCLPTSEHTPPLADSLLRVLLPPAAS